MPAASQLITKEAGRNPGFFGEWLGRLLSSERVLIRAVTATYLGCLVPLLAAVGYCHPYFDDYAIPSLVGRIGLPAYLTHTYLNSSGRFTASLISFVHPFRHSLALESYRLWVAGMVLGLALALPLAVLALLRGAGVPRRWQAAVSLGFGSVFLLLMPSPAEGLYWLIGALSYTVPIVGGSLLLGLWAWKSQLSSPVGRLGCYIGSLLLAFLLPGFSEVLACAALSLALVAGLYQWQRPCAARGWWLLPAVATLGALLLLAAPGNYLKAGQTLGTVRWAGSLGRALLATAYMLVNWLGSVPLLLGSLLYLPLGRRLARCPATPQAALLVRLAAWPWTGPVAGTLTLFSSNLLCFLALNQPPPARCRNLLLFLLLLCWVVTLQTLVQSWPSAWVGRAARPLRLAGVPVLGLLAASDFNPTLRHEAVGRHFSSISAAYQEWQAGEWQAYDLQQRQRRQLLQTSTQLRVEVPPLAAQPSTLFYWDLLANPAQWGNQVVAQAFCKEAVWVSGVASSTKSK